MNDTEAKSPEPLVPLPAATIMLLRDAGPDLEVLVLRKASGKHFSGGALVFPGGKAEREDAAFAEALDSPSDDFTVLKIAAVREMYEECRILLARRQNDGAVLSDAEAAALGADSNETAILDLVRTARVDLAVDQLVRFAHWITPPSRPKRYDTHFFVAPAPPDQQQAIVDGYEIVDANWCRPGDLLDEVHAGRLKLVLPTMMNLIKLSHWGSTEEVLDAAHREDVVCVRPKHVETDDGDHIVIPAEAGYGVTSIPTRLLRSA